MTQAAHRPRMVALGTGGGTRGPFNLTDESGNAIYFEANADIDVYRYATDGTRTQLTESTDYTLTGGPSSGVINLTTVQAVLLTNEKLVAERKQTIQQMLDLVNSAAFSSSNVEARFDILCRILQEVNDKADRGLLLSRTELTGYELPPARNRGPADSIQRLLGFSTTTGEPTLFATTDLANTAIPAAILAALSGATSLGDLLGNLGVITAPGGRLTLTSATPVTTGDVSAATSIYYTPCRGALVPIYDGDEFITTTFSELTLALSSNSGHTGYHQSGKNFDLFIVSDGGTVRLVSGPAWSSDTARASAVSMIQGIYTNTASMTARYGSGSGDTITVAAGCGTLVGTFRASANGQTEDSTTKRFVWNCYNRAPRALIRKETTDSWTYTTAAFRQANNNASNQVEMVCGLNEDQVICDVSALAENTSGGVVTAVGIGLDSTTVNNILNIRTLFDKQDANTVQHPRATFAGYVGLGYHKLCWLEFSVASGTSTWYGDNGGAGFIQSGMEGTFFA